MISPFLLRRVLFFREYSSKDIAIILNFTGFSLYLEICSTFVYSISEYEAYPSHTIFFREYMHLSQSILYIFHCIFTLLNYYLGLSNGPPCWHLPQCFGPKWPNVAQSGPKWPKVAQSGLKWPKVVQTAQIAQSGPKWPKRPKLPKVAKSGPNSQSGPMWPKVST